MSTQPSKSRSVLATVVGYLMAAVVALFLFQFVAGTIFWLLRIVVVAAILLGLLTLYLKLKTPD
jgi:uncharacterized membrane protein YdjX (TVP38/TMEM64 family)